MKENILTTPYITLILATTLFIQLGCANDINKTEDKTEVVINLDSSNVDQVEERSQKISNQEIQLKEYKCGNQNILIKSVLDNNIQEVIKYSKNKKYLNEQDECGNTALIYAAKEENTKIFLYLLKSGANPLIKNYVENEFQGYLYLIRLSGKNQENEALKKLKLLRAEDKLLDSTLTKEERIEIELEIEKAKEESPALSEKDQNLIREKMNGKYSYLVNRLSAMEAKNAVDFYIKNNLEKDLYATRLKIKSINRNYDPNDPIEYSKGKENPYSQIGSYYIKCWEIDYSDDAKVFTFDICCDKKRYNIVSKENTDFNKDDYLKIKQWNTDNSEIRNIIKNREFELNTSLLKDSLELKMERTQNVLIPVWTVPIVDGNNNKLIKIAANNGTIIN